MPKMGIALATADLNPVHSVGMVLNTEDVGLLMFGVERRPATTGIKLHRGCKEEG